MFSKLSILFLASVAVLAVATPAPAESPSACSTGDLQCCEQTGSATDPGFASVLTGLGVNVQDIDALVGLTCSPITVSSLGAEWDLEDIT